MEGSINTRNRSPRGLIPASTTRGLSMARYHGRRPLLGSLQTEYPHPRYADQAKKIKNKAVVNEDPNAKLVRELKEELEMLRACVAAASGGDHFDPNIPPKKQTVTYKTKDVQTVVILKTYNATQIMNPGSSEQNSSGSEDDGAPPRRLRPRVSFPGLLRLGLRGVKSVTTQVLMPFVLAFPSLTHLDLSEGIMDGGNTKARAPEEADDDGEGPVQIPVV